MNSESTPEFRAELKRIYDRARGDVTRGKKRTPKPSAPAGEIALVLD